MLCRRLARLEGSCAEAFGIQQEGDCSSEEVRKRGMKVVACIV